MHYDPALLDELARCFAEAAVRAVIAEQEKDAVGLGGQLNGVKDDYEDVTPSARGRSSRSADAD